MVSLKQGVGRDVSFTLPENSCRRVIQMSSREGILVYGASWCPDARRARRFFDEHGVAYAWIDIDEDEEASNFVRNTNGGQIIIPVIVFPDKSILVEPSNYELTKKLGGLFGEADPQSQWSCGAT